MPAKPKAKKSSKASGVPAKPDHPEDTPAPARDPKPTSPAATTATAGTAPAMSTPAVKPTPNGKTPTGGKAKAAGKATDDDVASVGGKGATGGKAKAGGGKATAAVADALEDSPAEPDAATSDEEEAPANPLEALRRAQAKRVPPPGTQPRFGGSGTRGGNPSAPRHYNRHK